MLIFAIESSCDETAASVIKAEGNHIEVLSNVVSSQIAVHALYGGVVPEIASRAHCEAISGVVSEAVLTAGIQLADLDAIAVTFAPGLIGSLLVGVNYAKALASVLKIPLIPVNHIEAHVAAAYIENDDLEPPYLALVVSGGHTSLYQVTDWDSFEEIGSSRDDACGEAFDKVGRVMGLPYPGGAAMDRLASEAFKSINFSSQKALSFPSPAVNDDSYDFSFSGLKTAVINYIHHKQQIEKTEELVQSDKAEIAGAFTLAVTEGINKKLLKAISDTKAKTLVMAGGVAANSHLRSSVSAACQKCGVRFIVPSMSLCGDNAAMTASAGYHLYKLGIIADSSLNACASDEGAFEVIDEIKRRLSRKIN